MKLWSRGTLTPQYSPLPSKTKGRGRKSRSLEYIKKSTKLLVFLKSISDWLKILHFFQIIRCSLNLSGIYVMADLLQLIFWSNLLLVRRWPVGRQGRVDWWAGRAGWTGGQEGQGGLVGRQGRVDWWTA